jgi:hypothetical protein
MKGKRAATVVDFKGAAHLHLEAVSKLEAELLIDPAPHRDIHGGRGVFDLEVAMAAAGVRPSKARDLPYDDQLRELVYLALYKGDSLAYRQRLRQLPLRDFLRALWDFLLF